jgi:hypothetical protein
MARFRQNKHCVALFIVILIHLAYMGLRLNTPFIVNVGLWDLPITIDGAYRLMQGQFPHADYVSPFGPVSFAIPWLGMQFLGKTMAGYCLGLALFSLAASIMLYLVLVLCQVPALISLGMCIVQASYMLTPRIFGFYEVHFGLLGIYNVEAFALLMIIWCQFIFAFLNPSSSIATSKEWLDRMTPAIFGFCCLTLCFLKVSFGVVAVCLYLLMLGLKWRDRGWIKTLLTTSVLTLVAWGSLVGFRIDLALADYYIALISRSEIPQQTTSIGQQLHSFLTNPLPLLVRISLASGTTLVLSFFFCSKRFRPFQQHFLSSLIFCAKVCGIVMLATIIEAWLASTISQAIEFFVLPVTGLVFICYSFTFVSHRRYIQSILFNSILTVTLFAIALFLTYRNTKGLQIYSSYRDLELVTNTFQANKLPKTDNFRDLYSGHAAATNLSNLLTRPHLCGQKSAKIHAISVPDLYTAAHNRESPRKSYLYSHYGVSFSRKAVAIFPERLGPGNILGDVDVLLASSVFSANEGRVAFLEVYKDYISEHFQSPTEEEDWTIYCRKDS